MPAPSSVYPDGYDVFPHPVGGDPSDNPSQADAYVLAADAVLKMQQEIGLVPSGGFATLKARLDALTGWLSPLDYAGAVAPVAGSDNQVAIAAALADAKTKRRGVALTAGVWDHSDLVVVDSVPLYLMPGATLRSTGVMTARDQDVPRAVIATGNEPAVYGGGRLSRIADASTDGFRSYHNTTNKVWVESAIGAFVGGLAIVGSKAGYFRGSIAAGSQSLACTMGGLPVNPYAAFGWRANDRIAITYAAADGIRTLRTTVSAGYTGGSTVPIDNAAGVTVSNVLVYGRQPGSGGCGVYVSNSEGTTRERLFICHTGADVLHMTGGSSRDAVDLILAINGGDDIDAVNSKYDGSSASAEFRGTCRDFTHTNIVGIGHNYQDTGIQAGSGGPVVAGGMNGRIQGVFKDAEWAACRLHGEDSGDPGGGEVFTRVQNVTIEGVGETPNGPGVKMIGTGAASGNRGPTEQCDLTQFTVAYFDPSTSGYLIFEAVKNCDLGRVIGSGSGFGVVIEPHINAGQPIADGIRTRGDISGVQHGVIVNKEMGELELYGNVDDVTGSSLVLNANPGPHRIQTYGKLRRPGLRCIHAPHGFGTLDVYGELVGANERALWINCAAEGCDNVRVHPTAKVLSPGSSAVVVDAGCVRGELRVAPAVIADPCRTQANGATPAIDVGVQPTPAVSVDTVIQTMDVGRDLGYDVSGGTHAAGGRIPSRFLSIPQADVLIGRYEVIHLGTTPIAPANPDNMVAVPVQSGATPTVLLTLRPGRRYRLAAGAPQTVNRIVGLPQGTTALLVGDGQTTLKAMLSGADNIRVGGSADLLLTLYQTFTLYSDGTYVYVGAGGGAAAAVDLGVVIALGG